MKQLTISQQVYASVTLILNKILKTKNYRILIPIRLNT
jgi:hypothetical protein